MLDASKRKTEKVRGEKNREHEKEEAPHFNSITSSRVFVKKSG